MLPFLKIFRSLSSLCSTDEKQLKKRTVKGYAWLLRNEEGAEGHCVEDPCTCPFKYPPQNAAMITVAALEAAGPELTPESLTAAMESIEVPNIFTGDTISYGPGGRQGSTAVYLSQIQGGQWSFVEKLQD